MIESVARLRGDQLTLGYGKFTVAENLNVSIPDGHFTAIIGPNGCGKSTLLRTLSRLMTPAHGKVWLDGEHIQHYASKEVARRIGLLAQNATTPGDITVQELVARGRYPHQPLFTRWRNEDEIAVSNAMQATGITHLASQSVDTLSGGQRQRAWIAMVLAQETSIMLLDEPTTWLDISHQIDLLELLSELNREKGYTLAAVLHDLNQACRYATHLIALRDGKIVAEGAPKEIVTAQLIEKIYGLRCMIIDDPVAGTPLVVPLGAINSKIYRLADCSPPDEMSSHQLLVNKRHFLLTRHHGVIQQNTTTRHHATQQSCQNNDHRFCRTIFMHR